MKIYIEKKGNVWTTIGETASLHIGHVVIDIPSWSGFWDCFLNKDGTWVKWTWLDSLVRTVQYEYFYQDGTYEGKGIPLRGYYYDDLLKIVSVVIDTYIYGFFNKTKEVLLQCVK